MRLLYDPLFLCLKNAAAVTRLPAAPLLPPLPFPLPLAPLHPLFLPLLQVNPNNSVVAFKDNSSAIRGFNVKPMLPALPGSPSPLMPQHRDWDLLLTAETHNFPCAVAPYPGGEREIVWGCGSVDPNPFSLRSSTLGGGYKCEAPLPRPPCPAHVSGLPDNSVTAALEVWPRAPAVIATCEATPHSPAHY